MFRTTLTALLLLVTASAATASCGWGTRQCPIRIKMARGADTIVLTGRTRQNVECCDYIFRARAGQRLFYKIEGATLRTTITYPNGEVDGPAIPNPTVLLASGDYRLAVHPNLMAEGAYGPYRLTITIR